MSTKAKRSSVYGCRESNSQSERRGPKARPRLIAVLSLVPMVIIGFALILHSIGESTYVPSASSTRERSDRSSNQVASARSGRVNVGARSARTVESPPTPRTAARQAVEQPPAAVEQQMSQGIQPNAADERNGVASAEQQAAQGRPTWTTDNAFEMESAQRSPGQQSEPEADSEPEPPVLTSKAALAAKRAVEGRLKRKGKNPHDWFLFSVSQEYFVNGRNSKNGKRRDVGFHVVQGIDETSDKLAAYLSEFEDESKPDRRSAATPRRTWTLFDSFANVSKAESALEYRLKAYQEAVTESAQRRERIVNRAKARRAVASVTRGGAGFRSRS